MSIANHVEDILDILKDLDISTIDAFLGWSTGVQVVLEFASVYPDRVDKLILLNGSYGHTMHHGLQPFLRLPILHSFGHFLMRFWKSYTATTYRILAPIFLNHKYFIRFVLHTPYAFLYGDWNLEYFSMRFMEDIFGWGQLHYENMMRFIGELDSHSVYHLLSDIQHPTLIVSGFLDPLTPAYLSFEMERLLPHATHICLPFGTHFALLEFPKKLSSIFEDFVNERIGSKVHRVSSTIFRPVVNW